jgi:acyl transferase domain-containing protein/acyl-CoA synthetase (AMP-forming)/AMP-acid ligase II/acyl carrier protein
VTLSTQEPPTSGSPGGPTAAESVRTLRDLLQQRAERYRDRLAFSFSRDGEEQEVSRLTYQELDAKARNIASSLQQQGASGERVLVLCPPGLDFIAALFGCFYAGAIGVPVHPPMRDHLVPRVASIVVDAQPSFALATAEVQAKIKPTIDGLVDGRPLRWCVADAGDGDGQRWAALDVPDIDGNAAAMVQYTSGSTSAPKGVVLTHRNLLHNLETIRQAWHGDDQAIGVFWLPPFHDMGLIGGILETLYVGGSTVLMSPTAFIKRPMRWLEAISRHRGTITAAPNFAYDMCVELSTPEERAALDLSSWSTAMCGAEPVRSATLEGFADAFAPAGFRPEAFYPVYGLAEATLLVSGGSDSAEPVVAHLDRLALRENRVVDVAPDNPAAAAFVGCGRPQGGQRVIVVDPDNRRQCAPDEVGEIWVAGPSVARGYWDKPEQSEETFSAYPSEPADTGDGPFLRTGDLGFLHSGELFVTGRCKDLIIIRGSNHYPNDIELTVQDCNPALLRGRGAVFAITPEPGGAEQLVVVQEVDPSRVDEAELTEIIRAIRTAVTERHEIRTHAVVLAQPLQLPTTSSGKIQRNTCRQQFLDGELPTVTAWNASPPATQPAGKPEAPAAQAETDRGAPSAAQIADWLISELSGALELPAAEIDPSQPFAYYGLDSIHAVRLTTALEAWLGCELPPTLAYEYPSIDLLSDHLAQLGNQPVKQAPAEDEAGVADEPIAIVGIGCRFPGADGPAAFWRLLSGGVDAISEVPPDRWDADAFYDPDPSVPGTAVTRQGGFLREVDQFDHRFFAISPRESAQMDPQQRLLLEVAWEALEDAGQVPDRLAGSRTGVFVGISTNDYGYLRLGQPGLVDAYTGTGNALSIGANRLSYFFDFHGPSMAIDTACSSSLVGVDLACRSLRDGECSMALAGGVNVMLSPALSINFTKARLMAPDGRCKTFDAGADGYVRGEGAGVVVLKPLGKALADNDPIHAVIRGTATNSDGRTNGLIAPSGRSQQAVLTEAYRRAGLSPGAAQYVEAHGTGTSLGDAIEATALGTVLANGRPPGSSCLVGSVKTNIGHLEAAAGMAGLIKTALALQHREIPPSLNFTEPNPHIPFDDLPLEVASAATPWPSNGGRAVAGVSSFGFGGTNAHVVLTEAPQVRATPADTATDRAELLPLSAKTPGALTALVGEYEMELAAGTPLADLCYTAGARRSHHEHRLAVVGDCQAAMFESLAAYRHDESRPGLSVGHCRPGHPPGVTFIFSGQGSQWHGMAQRLQACEPVFRDALAACDRVLSPHLGSSLLEKLDSGLDDIGVIQPAIFAVQVALAALWRSWGVEPAAVVGHSLGEVAAAHVAGALSLQDAAQVICARAGLLRRVHGRGTMVAAEATLAEAQELIAGKESQVAIAASNSHRSTVLSGEETVLTDLMAELQRRDRFCRWIDVDVASHSPQMDALGTDLRDKLAGLRPTQASQAKVPIYSTVTGDLLTDRVLDADYWVDNLCSPVRFSAALRRLLAEGHDTFVEVSPHPILLAASREDAEDLGKSCTLLPSMRRDDDGRFTALASLGTLYSLGQPISWEQLYPSGARCIAAPTYPWQHSRSWLEAGTIAEPRHTVPDDATRQIGAGPLPWRGPLRSAVHPQTVLAEVDIGTGLMPALDDHRVNGYPVLAAATLLQLVLAGATRAFGSANRVIRHVAFLRPLEFPDADPRTVQLVLQGDPSGAVSFECYRTDLGAPELLASGSLDADQPVAADGGLADARARCTAEIPGSSFYERLAEAGVQYEPKLQVLEKIWRGDGEALAQLAPAGRSPESVDGLDAAVLLDGCLSALAATLPEATGTYLPSGLTELATHGPCAAAAWCHAVLRPESAADPNTIAGDAFLLRDDGEIVVAARGLRLQRIPEETPTTAPADPGDRIYRLRWQPASIPPERDAPNRSVKTGSWLILGDGTTTADTLRDHLESHSQSCVVVEPGADFQCWAPDSYRIDPAQPEHFRRLLDEAFGAERPPCRGVVHLWSLLAAPPAETSTDALESATVLGPLSVTHLVQALAVAGFPDAPRLWLVTRGAQEADAGDKATEPVSIAQAPVWGLGRTIDHEYPELRCTRVDLSARGGPEELRSLFEEVCSDDPEPDVALRGVRRYVARLTRCDGAEPAETPAAAGGVCKPDATYLITGGLGALGLVMAGWLAEQGARHLVVMGRGSPSESAQQTLDTLRTAGTEVVVARGDVTRADQLTAALDSINASMPPLRGVVHAAGTVHDAILQRLDEQQLREVMAPKVQGAWNLHTLTRDAQLDFFLLFSSAASLLGSPGAANYGAANAFLDALAWHRRAEGRPALSVNWGPWAGLGFFTRSELHRHFTYHGVEAVPAAECLQALSYLLHRSATQAAVLDIDWARWCSRLGSGVTKSMLAELYVEPAASKLDVSPTTDDAPQPKTSVGDALRGAGLEERRHLLESYLRDLIAGKLGLAPSSLDVSAPLNGLGVDSLITLELRIQIERDLGIVVPVARLLDGPSVTSLSDRLADQLAANGSAAGTDAANGGAGRNDAQPDTAPAPEAAAGSRGVDLLARVSELSDDAVEELLRKVLAEREDERKLVAKEGGDDG